MYCLIFLTFRYFFNLKKVAVFSFPPDFLANEGEERERLILQSKSLTMQF
jgi:hypothetical protein